MRQQASKPYKPTIKTILTSLQLQHNTNSHVPRPPIRDRPIPSLLHLNNSQQHIQVLRRLIRKNNLQRRHIKLRQPVTISQQTRLKPIRILLKPSQHNINRVTTTTATHPSRPRSLRNTMFTSHHVHNTSNSQRHLRTSNLKLLMQTRNQPATRFANHNIIR